MILRFLKISILLVIFSFVSGCFYGQQGVDSSSGIIVQTGNLSNDTNKIGTRRTSRRSNKCSQEDFCVDICEEVYNDDNEDENDGKVELCLNKSTSTVEKFLEYRDKNDDQKLGILDLLEEPSPSNLRLISQLYINEFEELLDISIAPWIDYVDSHNADDSKNILYWLVNEPDILVALNDAKKYELFEEHKGVKELLENIDSLHEEVCVNYAQVICREEIANGKTFDQLYRSLLSAQFLGSVFADILRECNGKITSLKKSLGAKKRYDRYNNRANTSYWCASDATVNSNTSITDDKRNGHEVIKAQ